MPLCRYAALSFPSLLALSERAASAGEKEREKGKSKGEEKEKEKRTPPRRAMTPTLTEEISESSQPQERCPLRRRRYLSQRVRQVRLHVVQVVDGLDCLDRQWLQLLQGAMPLVPALVSFVVREHALHCGDAGLEGLSGGGEASQTRRGSRRSRIEAAKLPQYSGSLDHTLFCLELAASALRFPTL
jgi:hypothetical protein